MVSRVSDAPRRGVVALLEATSTRLWGFSARLMAPIVAQMGPVRALSWFVRNMPRYERTLNSHGEVRTHLLCVAISLINGCRYCTYGHAYALQLAHLRQHGRLFPLDEHAIGRLLGQPPAAIRHQLSTATLRAGLVSDIRWLQRAITLTLSPDRRPTDHDEVYIAHLVRMFGVLNTVGIASNTAPDQAHSPLNKDTALKLRYAWLRARAAREANGATSS